MRTVLINCTSAPAAFAANNASFTITSLRWFLLPKEIPNTFMFYLHRFVMYTVYLFFRFPAFLCNACLAENNCCIFPCRAKKNKKYDIFFVLFYLFDFTWVFLAKKKELFPENSVSQFLFLFLILNYIDTGYPAI
jgi:hypothetical protein